MTLRFILSVVFSILVCSCKNCGESRAPAPGVMTYLVEGTHSFVFFDLVRFKKGAVGKEIFNRYFQDNICSSETLKRGEHLFIGFVNDDSPGFYVLFKCPDCTLKKLCECLPAGGPRRFDCKKKMNTAGISYFKNNSSPATFVGELDNKVFACATETVFKSWITSIKVNVASNIQGEAVDFLISAQRAGAVAGFLVLDEDKFAHSMESMGWGFKNLIGKNSQLLLKQERTVVRLEGELFPGRSGVSDVKAEIKKTINSGVKNFVLQKLGVAKIIKSIKLTEHDSYITVKLIVSGREIISLIDNLQSIMEFDI